MKAKHTKGKWKLGSQCNNIGYQRIGKGSLKCIAIDIPYHKGHIMTWGHNDDEHKANAKLIAAAPALLKALKKITEMNYQTAQDQYGNRNKAKGWSCVEIAEQAIKKAE